jgi:NADH:ubiquinone oxidoreductase subunit F (NADH-binding)/Pyruvate/2-oxoacid:ferredoxin oxidoreductase delta subunit
VDDFLSQQKQIATEHAATLEPLDIEEYQAGGGFVALRKCLTESTPESVLTEIENAGLRGRGGGGYPTHLKWFAVQKADAEKKCIVCNGDEGDPGAFMDRMLMESYPFRVLEGMAIAAWTVGANEGVLYIRAEYPLAIQRINAAIETCHQRGYLGQSICSSDFSLDVRVCAGAGAFVCGEETALLKSIEGKRPTPRLRPPYPTQQGLEGAPTLVNNVETYVLVPWILRNRAEAFSALGTLESKGTKVFALAGKIRRGGLIEVPMGMTISQIVKSIGGGIEKDKQLKAVQIGGPSGGCVPASMADTAIDYESLHTAGAMMGSGGLVVLDETDCMVDIARYFLEFTQAQSCGRCTFCRIGTKRMLEILERLCDGQGQVGDIEKLQELGSLIRKASICGLGKTAPNPVLSTIKHFRDEYKAHIGGTCPAGKCRSLIHYSITDNCIGCTICAQHCPADAIAMKPYEKHIIDQQKCIRCDTCKQVCPAKAVEVI